MIKAVVVPSSSSFLSISSKDYIEMLSDFKYYMEQPLEKVCDRGIGSNPIGSLGGGVNINFVHYRNFEMAKDSWDKRVARINYNNLFVLVSFFMFLCFWHFQPRYFNKYGFSAVPLPLVITISGLK